MKLLEPKLIFCDHDVLDKIEAALEEIEYKVDFVTFNEYSGKALMIDQFYQAKLDEDNYE